MATDRERWFRFFYLFDADKSGDISQEDITLGMKNFAVSMGIKEGTPDYEHANKAYSTFMNGLIKANDTNGDGRVTKQEFETGYEKMMANGRHGIPDWWRQSIDILFSCIDTNKNGEISLEEVKAMAKKVEPQLTDQYIEHAYEWAKKATKKDKIDGETFMDLVWLYVTIPGPAPELDVFFVYFIHSLFIYEIKRVAVGAATTAYVGKKNSDHLKAGMEAHQEQMKADLESRSVFLYPCGHIPYCDACYDANKESTLKCPYCNTPITDTFHVNLEQKA